MPLRLIVLSGCSRCPSFPPSTSWGHGQSWGKDTTESRLDGSWQLGCSPGSAHSRGHVRKTQCCGTGLHHVGTWQITLVLPVLGISSFQDTALWFNFISSKERGKSVT